MADSRYIGHPSQCSGVEEHRLAGGKGDGMRLFEVRNGKGLAFTVSADRCADIARLSFGGVNFGYFSPCGYVAPSYYDKSDFGFLKSFTCGFLTTCGLTTIGSPSEEAGTSYPLHGTISHVPAEQLYYVQDDENIRIHALISDSAIFNHKLELNRKIICSTMKNTLVIEDTIKNRGDSETPLLLLYHFNMGYPLLDEHAELIIPSNRVEPRDARAAEGIGEWNKMLPPQARFQEQCYYHFFQGGSGSAMLFNKGVGKGLVLRFDAELLDHFVEWKMMAERDYVLGLEPCNASLEGRKALGEKGALKMLAPGEEKTFRLEAEFYDNYEQWFENRKG